MSNNINIKEGEACSIEKKNVRITELSRTSG